MTDTAKLSAESCRDLTEEYVKRLKDLTEVLESRDDDRIHELVAELTSLRESELYQELGKLTREIHDAIRAFGNDERVAELAIAEIPDAKERLMYIVTKTDEAAHRTMEQAEATMSLSDQISSAAGGMHERWQKLRKRELSKDDFIELNRDMDTFLNSINGETQQINTNMTDVMLAQDYQDITGQMIKQVVTMVQEIEQKLVGLVTISSAHASTSTIERKSDSNSGEIAEGPQLPSADNESIANSQDDVDDILANLGF